MQKIQMIIILATILSIVSCREEVSNKVADSDAVSIEASPSVPAKDTVNNARLVNAESDGSYLLTAETGKPVGPAIKYMPEWKAFGWFTSDDRVEWEVDISKGRRYDVFLEWSVSDEQAGKQFLMEVGGDQLTGIVKKTGSWETYKSEKIGSMKFNEGKQVIVFRSKSAFNYGALMDLRNLRLVPAN